MMMTQTRCVEILREFQREAAHPDHMRVFAAGMTRYAAAHGADRSDLEAIEAALTEVTATQA